MGGTGVIDRFLEVFTSYIDSGFGLLGGEVAYLATTLIVIDVTLAALFWAWGADDDILARLIKKTLFVGAFAYIISNWNALARIVFESFAGLGLQASGTGFSATDLMRPGRVAQVGLDAGRPILASISDLMGYVSFFENFIQIIVLMFAWAMVLLAFFILAIQLFITLIEFKLTTLAGFVLIPFGLFGEFTAGFGGDQPNIEEAMAIVLAALSLLGLGIFGPGIANGLISGGPQLSMGAAVGTGLVAGGVTAAGMAGTGMAAGAAGRGVLAGARGGAATVGGASAAYSLGSAGRTGAAGVASGIVGIARAGAGVATSPLRRAASALSDSAQGGARAAVATSGGAITGGGSPDAPTPSSNPPTWAARIGRAQTLHHGATAATHALRSGDSPGGGTSVSLSERDP